MNQQIFGISLAAFVAGFLTAALFLFICFKLARKAGYPGWKAFLMLIPVFNLVLLLIFTFGTWPIENELAATKRKL